MRAFLKSQSGLTLLEVVLVLVVGIAITLGAFQVYYRYKTAVDIAKVSDTVDKLFAAMSLYYQLNCRNPVDGNGGFITTGIVGVLDPTHDPVPSNPYPVPINIGVTSLVQQSFLPNTYWPPGALTFIDSTVGEYGFSAQFNEIVNATSHQPSGTYNNWVIVPPGNVRYKEVTGTVYGWQIHIAVKLASSISPTLYTYYQQRLAATCSASSPVTTCAMASAPGMYLIWERLPSYATKTNSILNMSMPRVRGFTNQYYTNDVYNASSPSTTNNYLCGG